jgi:hypothetical protein
MHSGGQHGAALRVCIIEVSRLQKLAGYGHEVAGLVAAMSGSGKTPTECSFRVKATVLSWDRSRRGATA